MQSNFNLRKPSLLSEDISINIVYPIRQFFMSKYSKEVKEKAIYLFEKGWNPFSIGKELGIPGSTVNGWLLKFKINHNINRKMVKEVFSADFKRKVIETRWKNKLSFKEVAEHFNLDNLSLIAAW